MVRPKAAASAITPRRAPGSIRIIGGRWKRRTLSVVDAPGLRPTPGRVRETLFNWLAHAYGNDWHGLSVLDLFAGTGALGIEAASRGAGNVMLVDNHPEAVKNLRTARSALDAPQLDIVEGDAVHLAEGLRASHRLFDLVLLDPPFGHHWIDTALPLAADLCRPGGYIYAEAEQPIADPMAAALGLQHYRTDKAGEVFYHLLRRNIKE